MEICYFSPTIVQNSPHYSAPFLFLCFARLQLPRWLEISILFEIWQRVTARAAAKSSLKPASTSLAPTPGHQADSTLVAMTATSVSETQYVTTLILWPVEADTTPKAAPTRRIRTLLVFSAAVRLNLLSSVSLAIGKQFT